jgi:hypothetical protein
MVSPIPFNGSETRPPLHIDESIKGIFQSQVLLVIYILSENVIEITMRVV